MFKSTHWINKIYDVILEKHHKGEPIINTVI